MCMVNLSFCCKGDICKVDDRQCIEFFGMYSLFSVNLPVYTGLGCTLCSV